VKPFKHFARTLGVCAPIALPLLFNGTIAAADGRGWGQGGWQHGGWEQESGTGTVTAETQPNSATACNADNLCQLTISGTGATGGFFSGIGEFDLQAELTTDLPGGTSNGFGGECYPLTGSLTLSPMQGRWSSGNLVVYVQGQDCAVGSSTTLSAVNAAYAVDGADSTGRFAGATGTGTVSAALDTSQTPPAFGFAFSGSLQSPSNSTGDNGTSKSAR
jgi:hypothetical protein